ncbi:MAG: diguanylate cyclase [Actinobacteria bacterium]|nr:diguanylate cyclase [Actinomycetota bacterium]
METRTPATDGTRPLVLIVDDDPDVRMLAHIQLTDGFDVIQAADGQTCLELAAAHAPDVILLDMMMPGMDGAEVLTALSSHAGTADIPVIFLSVLSAVEDKVRGLQGGAVDYIAKPFEPTELRARVGAAARTKARHEAALRSAGGDALTGLPERGAFEARLVEEISRARRSGSALSIILIDIDQVDQVNERFGRGSGDQLLRDIAGELVEKLRHSDILFRHGGDEFAVILPDTNVSTAYLAGERLRTAIAKVQIQGQAITASVGVSDHSPGHTAEDLIARAEVALFRAKESGGNQSWRADDPRRRGLNPISLSEELTDREWDVLAHLSQKRTEQEIARRLGISAGTVRSHKARIRRKLHVSADVRLSEFVKANLHDLVTQLGRSASERQPIG